MPRFCPEPSINTLVPNATLTAKPRRTPPLQKLSTALCWDLLPQLVASIGWTLLLYLPHEESRDFGGNIIIHSSGWTLQFLRKITSESHRWTSVYKKKKKKKKKGEKNHLTHPLSQMLFSSFTALSRPLLSQICQREGISQLERH